MMVESSRVVALIKYCHRLDLEVNHKAAIQNDDLKGSDFTLDLWQWEWRKHDFCCGGWV